MREAKLSVLCIARLGGQKASGAGAFLTLVQLRGSTPRPSTIFN